MRKRQPASVVAQLAPSFILRSQENVPPTATIVQLLHNASVTPHRPKGIISKSGNSAMFNIYVRPFWVIPRSSRHTPGTSLRFSVYILSHSRYRTILRWMWVSEVRCNFLEKQESRYKTCDCFSSCKLFFVLQAKTKIQCKCPPGRTSQLVNIKLLSARRYWETWSQSNHWSKNDSYRYYWFFCLQYDIGTV